MRSERLNPHLFNMKLTSFAIAALSCALTSAQSSNLWYTPAQIVHAFQVNEVNANSLFQDRQFGIKAVIEGVRQAENCAPLIDLNGDNWYGRTGAGLPNVVIALSSAPEFIRYAASLRKSDRVHLMCSNASKINQVIVVTGCGGAPEGSFGANGLSHTPFGEWHESDGNRDFISNGVDQVYRLVPENSEEDYGSSSRIFLFARDDHEGTALDQTSSLSWTGPKTLPG